MQIKYYVQTVQGNPFAVLFYGSSLVLCSIDALSLAIFRSRSCFPKEEKFCFLVNSFLFCYALFGWPEKKMRESNVFGWWGICCLGSKLGKTRRRPKDHWPNCFNFSEKFLAFSWRPTGAKVLKIPLSLCNACMFRGRKFIFLLGFVQKFIGG